MTEAARAWLSGFGSVLVCRVPFDISRQADGEGIVFAHHSADGVRTMLVRPGETSANTTFSLGNDTSDSSDVLDFVEETRFSPGWRVVARHDARSGKRVYLSCAFPSGGVLFSTPWDVGWPFELSLAGAQPNELIYVQGPLARRDCPELEDLCAAGMRCGESGTIEGASGACEWLDFLYVRHGIEWRQRRFIVPLATDLVAFVTTQSTEQNVGRAVVAAGEVVATLSMSDEYPE